MQSLFGSKTSDLYRQPNHANGSPAGYRMIVSWDAAIAQYVYQLESGRWGFDQVWWDAVAASPDPEWAKRNADHYGIAVPTMEQGL